MPAHIGHHFSGGTIRPLEQLQAVCKVAHDHGLKTHLDGARLLNAAVASNRLAADYAASFDTVMLCLSKGLGLSDWRAARRRCRRHRPGADAEAVVWRFDAAVWHLSGCRTLRPGAHVPRLAEDHANAHLLAEGLADVPGFAVEMPMETNMVFVNVQRTGMTAADVAARLRQAGWLFTAWPLSPAFRYPSGRQH